MSIFFRTCRSPQTLSYVRPSWYVCVGFQICVFRINPYSGACLCCAALDEAAPDIPMQPSSVAAFFGGIYSYGRLRASVGVLPPRPPTSPTCSLRANDEFRPLTFLTFAIAIWWIIRHTYYICERHGFIEVREFLDTFYYNHE